MVENLTLYSETLKSLWAGRCTVVVMANETDKKTGRTVKKEVVLYKDEPCRISYEKVKPTEKCDNAEVAVQSVKLFIDAKREIPAGSKIAVTQNGVTEVYKKSGRGAVYSSHCEIPLEICREWA